MAFNWLAEHFELPILDWIADNLRHPVLDGVFPLLTRLGDKGIFWILLAVCLLFFKKTRKAALSMGLALLIGLVVCNLTMKPLLARMRPYDYQLTHFGRTVSLLIAAPSDFSFPSGHTLASFEAAIALTLFHRKWGIPALVLAGVIAWSRLYLYVHYPSDVLFSLLLSVGIAFLAVYLVKQGFDRWEKRIKKDKNTLL
ncbi:MAG: phosphatase PAP2 family protein [Ruminococcaceae bacterium]|nr:phosphatase PAP2 family protein [Oscillospiraceae bacterium]